MPPSGFTGAPALTVEDDAVREIWGDLGERWRILEMYFKPYPVCRWGQPAIEAALEVRRAHAFAPEDIGAIDVFTFHEATRLDQHEPATTEEAQYSLPFPVAAALVRGGLVPEDIAGDALTDDRVLAVSRKIRLVDDPALSARFPAERYARIRVELADGRIVESGTLPARGDAETPLSDDEITAKFHALADGPLGSRANLIEQLVAESPGATDVTASPRRFAFAARSVSGMRVEETVWIPLADGCRLAARIWFPDEATLPAPVVLEYLPYRRRDRHRGDDALLHPGLASRGFVAVRVDIRGSGDSDGILLDEYTAEEGAGRARGDRLALSTALEQRLRRA